MYCIILEVESNSALMVKLITISIAKFELPVHGETAIHARFMLISYVVWNNSVKSIFSN